MKARIVFLGLDESVPQRVVLEVEAVEPDRVLGFISQIVYDYLKRFPLKPVGELSPEESLGREIYRALRSRNEK